MKTETTTIQQTESNTKFFIQIEAKSYEDAQNMRAFLGPLCSPAEILIVEKE